MSKLNIRHLFAWTVQALILSAPMSAPAQPTDAPSAPAPSAPAPSAPTPSAPAPSAPTPAAPAPAAPVPAAVAIAPMTGAQVIQVLDQTIDWYRTLGVQQQVATEPSDLLILNDNRQIANQVVGLAFEIARTDAELLAKQPQPKDAGGASPTSQSLSKLQDKFAAQGAAVQEELNSTRAQLAKARPEQKIGLHAKIAELQGELELINVRRSLLATMSTLSNQSDSGGFSATALKGQIDAMAVTTPSATGATPGAAPLSATPPSAAPSSATPSSAAPSSAAPSSAAPFASLSAVPSMPAQSAPATGNTAQGGSAAPAAQTLALTGASGMAAARFGLWDLAANVIRLSEKAATVGAVDQHTAALQTTFAEIRTPLIDRLKSLSARGDALATQADTADSATLNRVRDELDAVASQFKQISALLIPLSKEGVLLSQYRRNMANWRNTINNQYHNALKTLGVRLAVLAILLTIVFAAAEVWRRAVLRYVQDGRRRYQLLLLRRIAMWCLVIVIIGFAFASELGSVVTFAGLITAGLAVAMQSVLVSIVGYFFLIGKYGIRVGDRVQIGEVTGEVIDLGLVRLHLMELGGRGSLGPTGRIVAFANSVVFQVSSGLFKQIHGVNFVWREIAVNLPSGIDYTAAKEKLCAAVTTILKDDRDEIVRQTKEIQRATASSSGADVQPRVQLSFSATGVEAHVRYPVHLQNAPEIEERVSQSVYGAVAALGAESNPPPPVQVTDSR